MVGLLHKVWECRTRQGSFFSIRQQLQVASLSKFVITYRGGQSCLFVGPSIYTLASLWRPIGFWSSSLIPKILAQLLLCRHLEEINKDLSCFKSPGRDKPSTWNKRNINHWTSLFSTVQYLNGNLFLRLLLPNQKSKTLGTTKFYTTKIGMY